MANQQTKLSSELQAAAAALAGGHQRQAGIAAARAIEIMASSVETVADETDLVAAEVLPLMSGAQRGAPIEAGRWLDDSHLEFLSAAVGDAQSMIRSTSRLCAQAASDTLTVLCLDGEQQQLEAVAGVDGGGAATRFVIHRLARNIQRSINREMRQVAYDLYDNATPLAICAALKPDGTHFMSLPDSVLESGNGMSHLAFWFAVADKVASKVADSSGKAFASTQKTAAAV